jgi:hypothetical protein
MHLHLKQLIITIAFQTWALFSIAYLLHIGLLCILCFTKTSIQKKRTNYLVFDLFYICLTLLYRSQKISDTVSSKKIIAILFYLSINFT